ncbi:hypothetical protein ACX80E_05145 [Arthrobacter sp. TMN-49]
MNEMPMDLPGSYLALARKYLPEALPTRFGTYEPLQGKLVRDGDQAFSDMWLGNPTHTLYFDCPDPIGFDAIQASRENFSEV